MCADGSGEEIRFDIPSPLHGNGMMFMEPIGPNSLVFPDGQYGTIWEPENGVYTVWLTRIGGEGRMALWVYEESIPGPPIGLDLYVDIRNGCGGIARVEETEGSAKVRVVEVAPVPARESCSIRISPREELVGAEIFEVGGRVLARLTDREQGSQAKELTWDLSETSGTRVSPGVYFVRVRARDGWTGLGRILVLH